MRCCGVFGGDRNDRIFNNSIGEVEEVVEDVKVLLWRWCLSWLQGPACLFYECHWNPKACLLCYSAVFSRLRLWYAVPAVRLLSVMDITASALLGCSMFSTRICPHLKCRLLGFS